VNREPESRLYYTDSLLDRFDATVVESGTLADGRPFVVLDRTAFYPTSGGQPHDLGHLAASAVVDVVDREEDGAVLHVLSDALTPGTVVSGRVDITRRLDHIQQHSGQHLLSAAFIRACGAPTVSFHLGADSSTIDLTADLDAEEIARAEELANQVVWENRPVHVRFASPEEAASLPLRKEPKRAGTLRLVDIRDWDLSACGGTHVSATGAIGPVLVAGWERYKGGTRVSFVCGGRAIRHARQLRDTTATAARQLSVLMSELPEAVARLQAEQKALRHDLRAATARIAGYEAAALAASAVDLGGTSVAASIVDGYDGAGLKALAQAVATRPGHAAVLVSSSRPTLVVVARAEGASVDAGAVVKALLTRFGGRGGGRPELAQAGGLDADPAAVRDLAVQLVSGR
jgi:alanyl-tRNA synthetase